MTIEIIDADDAKRRGQLLGKLLRGGECIELIGDVGVGKTTFVKGVAAGMGVTDDDVQSPSFTISRVYEAAGDRSLHHYDFYRLAEPGVVSYELAESVDDPQAVTVIEWGETVADVLPAERIRLQFRYHPDDEARTCEVQIPDTQQYLSEAFV